MDSASRTRICLWLAIVAAAGCDREPTGRAATGSAAAKPTVARAELGRLCNKMCDRDVACAGETARQAAMEAGLEDVADRAAEKAIGKARAALSACKQDCLSMAEQGSAAGKAHAEAIEGCLAAADCTKYGACVDKVAKTSSTSP